MHTFLTYRGTTRQIFFLQEYVWATAIQDKVIMATISGEVLISNDDVTIANKAGYNRFLVLIS